MLLHGGRWFYVNDLDLDSTANVHEHEHVGTSSASSAAAGIKFDLYHVLAAADAVLLERRARGLRRLLLLHQ